MVEMKFERLSSFDAQEFADMRTLMGVLSSHCDLTEDMLTDAVRQASVFVARHEGHIIATATLAVFSSPTGRKASIEDVVVLPQYQGHGIGRDLVKHVLDEAHRLSPITLQLTSRPSRIAANALYRNLGFQQKETNFYKKAFF